MPDRQELLVGRPQQGARLDLPSVRGLKIENVVAVLEVPGICRPVNLLKQRELGRVQVALQLRGRPDIVRSFFAYVARVLGRIKSPFGVGHLPQHVIQRLTRHGGVHRVAGDLIGL